MLVIKWLKTLNDAFLQVSLYKSIAIGRSSHPEGSPETWVARPYEDTKPGDTQVRHSCIAISGSNESGVSETWYAMLHGLFSFSCKRQSQPLKGAQNSLVYSKVRYTLLT